MENTWKAQEDSPLMKLLRDDSSEEELSYL